MSVDEVAGGKNPAAVELGRLGGSKGGLAAAARMTREQRVRRAQIGAAARWGKPPPEPSALPPITLAGAQRELALVRRQITLLGRKEKALIKMIEGATAIIEMDAEAAGYPASDPG